MPRTCTICRHSEKEEIDRALVQGQPLRGIAERYGTSPPALHRHKAHLPAQIVKAQEAQETAHADGLLSQVQALQERALAVLAIAEQSGDLRAATGAIREARGCLDLLGRVTGELVQKHAHLHAHAHVEVAPIDLSVLEPDELKTLQRLAQKVASAVHREAVGELAQEGS